MLTEVGFPALPGLNLLSRHALQLHSAAFLSLFGLRQGGHKLLGAVDYQRILA